MNWRAPWHEELYSKAVSDPEFLQQLVEHRKAPGEVLEAAGIALSREELGELTKIMAADRLGLAIEWDNVVQLALRASPKVDTWPELVVWPE